MTPEELMTDILPFWPNQIEVDTSTNQKGDWQPIWGIIKAYEQAGRRIDPNKDRWLDLANWCFHQAITQVARSNYQAGKRSVEKKEVSIIEFDRRVVANLDEDGWEKERAVYIAIKTDKQCQP